MRILYDLAFIIFGIIYLPYFIVKKRYRHGLANRFGILSRRVKSISSNGRVIWIHAVSVGEMKAASILAPLLRKSFPHYTLVFSSVTHTGNKVARTIATGEEGVFYLPFDISFIVDKVVKAIKPELFLCLETELWPNLILSLYRFGAKVILVNGRISKKSFFGYKKIKFIVSRILNKFSLILMQSEQDAARILSLGAPKEKLHVTGNLKFDLSLLGPVSKRREIRKILNLSEEDILLVAGSTHRGEEEQIVDCFLKLQKEYPALSLLVAPRHIERIQEIERLILRRHLKSIRYSELSAAHHSSLENRDPFVFLLDTMGELRTIYSASDIVFVGKSLVNKGGQNPIEPASLAKPVIFGKFTFNFQDVVNSFLEDESAIRVENKDELYFAIKLLLDDPKEGKNLGMKAKETVDKNSGSGHRAIDLILSLYPA